MSFYKTDTIKIEKYVNKKGHLFASGSPTGRTGAPGEGSCAGCHLGAIQNGDTQNIFTLSDGSPVTSYEPGGVYTVTLSTNINSVKKGFQAIVLNGSNSMVGSFTGVSGNTSISNSGTREYANHTASSNTNATLTWTWTWNAPTDDAGDVTFYVATNKANGNASTSGDGIYLSQHVISSTLGLDEQNSKEISRFNVAYSATNNSASINFTTLSVAEISLNIADLNGKSIFSNRLGNSIIGENKQTLVLPVDIKNGMYIVQLLVGSKTLSKNLSVQR